MLLDSGLPQQSQMFGFPRRAPSHRINGWWMVMKFWSEELLVVHCPGHTPGHVVFSQSSRLAIVGDVLFQGSIGRTDFPKRDYDTLIRNIKTKLWALGDDVQFIPGHGSDVHLRSGKKNKSICG